MTTGQLMPDDQAVESLNVGGTWLLDLVAAVDHLRRGIRPGITVWDALEEARRWRAASSPVPLPDEPAWNEPDPLRGTLARFLDHAAGSASVEAQIAVRRWVLAMAARYNDGQHWPHPVQRRSFPPPRIEADLLDDLNVWPDGHADRS